MNRAFDSVRLRSLLEAEGEACAQLEALLDSERAAVATHDLPRLLDCLRQRELVQSDLERAARERKRFLTEAGTSLPALRSEAPELKDALDGLRRRAVSVRRAQTVNDGMLRAALGQVAELIAIVSRALPESRYDSRAALRTPLPRSPGGSWSA
jgi:flagellar biosynthesis/type III secretory pathway chaperone